MNDIQFNTLIKQVFGTNSEVFNNTFQEFDEKDNSSEEEEEVEMDVWNDGCELSIDDFKATGENLDDYDDVFDLEEITIQQSNIINDLLLLPDKYQVITKKDENNIDITGNIGKHLNESIDKTKIDPGTSEL